MCVCVCVCPAWRRPQQGDVGADAKHGKDCHRCKVVSLTVVLVYWCMIWKQHKDAHRDFQQNEREGVGKGHVSQPIQHIPHLVGLGGLGGTRQGSMVSVMLCISNGFLSFTFAQPHTSRLDNSRGKSINRSVSQSIYIFLV